MNSQLYISFLNRPLYTIHDAEKWNDMKVYSPHQFALGRMRRTLDVQIIVVFMSATIGLVRVVVVCIFRHLLLAEEAHLEMRTRANVLMK